MKPTAADIAHAPDALIINHLAPGEVAYDVPDGCAPNRGHRAEEGLASLR